MDGVLVIDKPGGAPRGPTSHDVVWKLRRALGMRRIGHAGTLDPMASGVLVMLLGEGTKLGPYLTAHDKCYEARVVLGRATDSLDAEGTITAEAPLPAWFGDAARRDEHLRAALATERERSSQIPPAYSAIKVSGAKSYDRARRGEVVELEPRPVAVRALELCASGELSAEGLGYLDVTLEVSKGYYVRSFARDLGEALGLPAHLGALRRTRSGPFGLDLAKPLDAPREELTAAVLPLSRAVRMAMPTAVLTEAGVARAYQGKRLEEADFSVSPPCSSESAAWLSPEDRLVAVGIHQQDAFVVQRGFVRSCDT